MTSELHNLSLFFTAIAKFLLMTGIGPAIAIAVIAECCGFRVVALGVEKVSSPSPRGERFAPTSFRPAESNPAISSPRKEVHA